MANIHDVLRYLIRRAGHADTATERDLLLSVDADEQGYDSLEAYKEKLAQDEAQAKTSGNPNAGADLTTGLTDEQLQAELARRQANAKPANPKALSPAAQLAQAQAEEAAAEADQVPPPPAPPAPVNPQPV